MKFRDKLKIKSHNQRFHDERLFTCDQCQQEFRGRINTKRAGFCTPKRIRELTETAPGAKRARSPFNKDFMERYPESVELHNKIKNKKS